MLAGFHIQTLQAATAASHLSGHGQVTIAGDLLIHNYLYYHDMTSLVYCLGALEKSTLRPG